MWQREGERCIHGSRVEKERRWFGNYYPNDVYLSVRLKPHFIMLMICQFHYTVNWNKWKFMEHKKRQINILNFQIKRWKEWETCENDAHAYKWMHFTFSTYMRNLNWDAVSLNVAFEWEKYQMTK